MRIIDRSELRVLNRWASSSSECSHSFVGCHFLIVHSVAAMVASTWADRGAITSRVVADVEFAEVGKDRS